MIKLAPNPVVIASNAKQSHLNESCGCRSGAIASLRSQWQTGRAPAPSKNKKARYAQHNVLFCISQLIN